MVARGEREVRAHPWFVLKNTKSTESATESPLSFCRTFSAHLITLVFQGRRARYARTRPWLSAAPAALNHLLRLRRSTLWRAYYQEKQNRFSFSSARFIL
ncbi:MAG TPA: hypothetical protein VJT15_04740 [Pyrinomonadaceae bacterium]|nr:hypothetical protein [Pyrinomonadaceae bacterium]